MIQIQVCDWCSLVSVKTEIDIGSYRQLEEALASCDATLPICVDFSTCPYMDSSGLGVVLRMRKTRDEQFWIIAPMKSQVRRLVDAAGVTTYLHIAESIDDAQRVLDKKERFG